MSCIEPSPYPGLRSFEEAERDWFFGRDAEIRILSNMIRANRLTLLLAASGVGKSSLLRAGVMPELEKEEEVDLVYCRDWAADPGRSLKEALIATLRRRQRLRVTRADDLKLPLPELLESFSLFSAENLILLLDQFEELFYYHRTGPYFCPFVEELSAAVCDPALPVRFVFSMREDFVMELDVFKERVPGFFDAYFRLDKLDQEMALSAVRKPAEKKGFHFEGPSAGSGSKSLLETLVEDLARRERVERYGLEKALEMERKGPIPVLVEPPHLQIVCSELWNASCSDPERRIRWRTYRDLGDTNGILQGYFTQRIKELRPNERRIASRAFDLLVSRQGTKVAYPLSDLVDRSGVKEGKLLPILERLQAQRILRREKRQEEYWYELYHDIFARKISDWNRDFKLGQRVRKGFSGLLAISFLTAAVLVGSDYWQNHESRHFRLSVKTGLSDRIEVWQGKTRGWDIFSQRRLLYETPFERGELEVDKQFVLGEIANPGESRLELIGKLTVQGFTGFLSSAFGGRIQSYWTNGFADLGLGLVSDTLKHGDYFRSFFALAQMDVHSTATIRFLKQTHQFPTAFSQEAPGDSLAYLLTHVHAELTPVRIRSNLLIEKLSDSVPGVRYAAVEALGGIGIDAAVGPLIERLTDADPEVQSAASTALIWIGTEAAAAPFILRLADESADVRYAAAEALARIGTDAAVGPLIERLADESADVRYAAVEALSKLESEAAVGPLIERLADESADVRAAAVAALGRIGTDFGVGPLIERLADATNYVRSAAAAALGQIGVEAAVAPLIERLADESADVRAAAVAALGRIGTEAVVAPLIERLADIEGYVRSAAATALSQIGTEATIALLIERLADESADVRAAAAATLGQISTEAVVAPLIERLADQNANVRSTAATALGQIGTEAVVAPLIERLDDAEPGVRKTIVDTLGRIGTEAIVPFLLEILAEKDPRVRQSAVKALGRIGVASVVAPLTDRLADESDDVRLAAVEALGQIGTETTVAPLLDRLADESAGVRSAAAAALGQIGSETAVKALLVLLGDVSVDVRRAAVAALGEIGSEIAVVPLTDRIDFMDPVVRQVTGAALAKIGVEAAVNLAFDRISSDIFGGAIGYQDAFAGLAEIGTVPAIAVLAELLPDGSLGGMDPNVPKAAAEALARIGTEAAVAPLIDYLEYSDHRYAAAATLAGISTQATLAILIDHLGSESSSIRREVAVALGRIGTEAAVAPLTERLADVDPDVRYAAARALSRLHPSEPVLVSWQRRLTAELAYKLPSSELDGQLKAINVLGNVPMTDSVELLKPFLSDPRLPIRTAAFEALGEIGEIEPGLVLLTLHSLGNRFKDQFQEAPTSERRAWIRLYEKLLVGTGNDGQVLETLIQWLKERKLALGDRRHIVDVLSRSGNVEVLDALLQAAEECEGCALRYHVLRSLARQSYAKAEETIRDQLEVLERDKQEWRANRDRDDRVASEKAPDFPSSQPTVKPNSGQVGHEPGVKWNREHWETRLGYALARVAPEKHGLRLLDHPLYQVRHGAILALAEVLDSRMLIDLMDRVRKYLQDGPMPRPFPYAAYQAIDLALKRLEWQGQGEDLERFTEYCIRDREADTQTAHDRTLSVTEKEIRASLRQRIEFAVAYLAARLDKPRPETCVREPIFDY